MVLCHLHLRVTITSMASLKTIHSRTLDKGKEYFSAKWNAVGDNRSILCGIDFHMLKSLSTVYFSGLISVGTHGIRKNWNDFVKHTNHHLFLFTFLHLKPSLIHALIFIFENHDVQKTQPFQSFVVTHNLSAIMETKRSAI